jgi:hypothetical protein
MPATHREHFSEVHSKPTASECAHNDKRPRGTHKRRTPLQPLPLARPALAAHCNCAPGPSKAARERSVDWIASRVSATAQTIVGSSWWLSAFERGLQVDLEHSTPTSSTNSPIVMVAPTPSRRDHLVLMRRPRTPPAGSCKAAGKRDERKRSIVQWRNAFSSAQWSANVSFGMAGGAGAGGEGTSSGEEPSWPARF